MRRLARPNLDKRSAAYLNRKTREVLTVADPVARKQQIGGEWEAARGTKTFAKGVFGLLCRMVGARRRCMYCEDSRGTDVEHFWPKSVYPEKAFDWLNMLLSCSGCQRAKDARFPLDANGRPLLVDPTAEQPWEYLFFVATTGMITPRFDRHTQLEMPKGRATVDLLPLNDEPVIEGRLRAYRNLARAVQRFLVAADAHEGPTVDPDAVAELEPSVADSGDYGLAEWCLTCEEGLEEPFRALRERYPDVADSLVRSL